MRQQPSLNLELIPCYQDTDLHVFPRFLLPPPCQVRLSELGRESGVIAHFVAHTGPNVHVAALAFNPRWVGSQQEGRIYIIVFKSSWSI